MTPRKIIIDTDPGCDDVLAMLLAFSVMPEELQVLMLSVTYGNVDVENCLRNVVSLFHHIEKELEWREQTGRPLGFDTLRSRKPLVAAGPNQPLAEQMLMADFFHGRDGLGDIDVSHPHLAPTDSWDRLLKHAEQSSDTAIVAQLRKFSPLFTPSHVPAHEEILRLLRENEPNTITIVAIGPLTNLAIAAAADPETFLRVQEVVVMGGAVNEPGNITPKAEFNTFADSIAAARLYALSSPNPSTTMPPLPPGSSHTSELRPYPPSLSKRLRVTLFPLDITNYHLVTRRQFQDVADPLKAQHSPLAHWVEAWLESTFRKIESLHPDTTGDTVGLQLHDPLTIWYCMTADDPKWQLIHNEDLRIETTGQWTRGMCVTDGRSRKKRSDDDTSEQPGDHGLWLRGGAGNRLSRCLDSPGRHLFGPLMLQRIFNLQDKNAKTFV
ncbi:hypothetical protein AMS68_007609 [Peltaster fructicola]|uniref:Inosine/uridine-preferring nucleoside hydrolase domain-containing protein n=1 Tax=Peltaster fructicola TaxID=286661 RepID=A0A6H0Y4X9_9PEZI|nr:hypothetical protein AMS68_007609 [Peltaster fructicola]